MRKLFVLFLALCGFAAVQADEIDAVSATQGSKTDWFRFGEQNSIVVTINDAGNPVFPNKTYSMSDGNILAVFGTAPAEKGTLTAKDFIYTAPANLIYDGNPKEATVVFNDQDGKLTGCGEITVKYQQNGVEATPIYAGDYTVLIDVAEGDNYAAATALTDEAWVFSITNSSPTTLFDTKANENVNKFLHNGQVIIRRGEKNFSVLGIEL